MIYIKKSVDKKNKNRNFNNVLRYKNRFKKNNIITRKKICRFCSDKIEIDYKNIVLLRTFLTDQGKIFSGRITGTCAKHQRKLSESIKRARILALLPFCC
jgi:small subunit ribosomal protein S18